MKRLFLFFFLISQIHAWTTVSLKYRICEQDFTENVCMDDVTLPASDPRRFAHHTKLDIKDFFTDQCNGVGENVKRLCLASKNFLDYSGDVYGAVSYAYTQISNMRQEMVNDLSLDPQKVG